MTDPTPGWWDTKIVKHFATTSLANTPQTPGWALTMLRGILVVNGLIPTPARMRDGETALRRFMATRPTDVR